MVNKNTIGKVQIGIGVTILILALIGMIYSIVFWSEGIKTTNFPLITEDTPDREVMLNYHLVNLNQQAVVGQIILLTNLAIGSLILFFISLLFITQGLANMSGGKINA